MKKEYRDIMVGLNNNNEIVTIGWIEIGDNNQFSLGFHGARIECPNDESQVIENYVENLLDSMDFEYKYKKCEWHDCSPSELPKCMAEDMSIYDVYDTISKYDDEAYYINEFEYKFPIYLDFSFSTPMDYKEEEFGEIVRFINVDAKRLFDKVNKLSQYHLKEISENIWEELRNDIETYMSDKNRFKEEVKFIEDVTNDMVKSGVIS